MAFIPPKGSTYLQKGKVPSVVPKSNYNPKNFNQDVNNITNSRGAQAKGVVKTPKQTAKESVAQYLAAIRAGAGGGGIPDYSGQIPGAPNFDQYTGSAVPDYGAGVQDSEFPGFKQGAATNIDPKTFARIAGQSYTPLLDNLKQQQAGYQASIATGNQQIDSAYNAATDLATKSRDKILGAGASAQAAGAQTASKLAASTGNDPLATAAATGANAIQSGYTGALAATDAQSAGDSAAAAERQSALAKLDYTNAAQGKANDAGTAAGQVAQQQGDAKQQALMQALTFNDTMRSNGLNRDVTAQSAKLASRLAGGEITAQDLQNAVTRGSLTKAQMDSIMTKTQFNNGVVQDNFNNQITKVNTVAQLKSLFKAGKAAGVATTDMPLATAALSDPTSYSNAEAQFVTPDVGADGVSITNPRKLYDKVFTAINQVDKQTPKNARAALARQLVQTTLAKYNSKNAEDWYWDGNTFTQRPTKK